VTMPTPTGEQQAIIDASQSGADLVIEAGAGTGKTSTLRLVATTQPRRRGLYAAYNKAIAADAKRSFPASVMCATAHSLAFRAVGRRLAVRNCRDSILGADQCSDVAAVGCCVGRVGRGRRFHSYRSGRRRDEEPTGGATVDGSAAKRTAPVTIPIVAIRTGLAGAGVALGWEDTGRQLPST
jgi:hypothetical protein